MSVQGWSAEMDRKLNDMRKDPDQYFSRAYREAREASTGWHRKARGQGRGRDASAT